MSEFRKPWHRSGAAWRVLLAGTCLYGCARVPAPLPVVPRLPQPAFDTGIATPRVSGPVGNDEIQKQVAVSTVPTIVARSGGGAAGGAGGSVSLNFADTDIREVASRLLGDTLHVNYTVDPAVHGTATLRTVTPLPTSQVIPVLQSLLAQNGATVVQVGGVYRVLPTAAAAGAPGGSGTAGGLMVPLRFAAADDLAKALQPYAQAGAKVVPVLSSNALVISGEPAQRDALVDLVRAFDVDELAGQSYALFPVESGDASDMADALKQAFRAASGQALASQIRVVAMARVNAVLVIANSPRYIADARRAFAVVERGRRQTMRTWHVYYLQNGTANDMAYVLQEAFTPGSVTAQPTAHGSGQPSNSGGAVNGIGGLGGTGSSGSGGSGGLGGSSGSSGGLGSSGIGGSSGSSGGIGGGLSGGSSGSGGQGAPTTPSAASTGSNPLLGGIGNSGGSSGADTTSMRIIPNPDNNAILVYATGEEEHTVEAMLHKIDIMPLQVRIDAIIAEVTLNDNLSYGTQFYFKHHAINGGLSDGSTLGALGLALPNLSAPGFVFNAAGKDGDLVVQALQDVTTVKILSSPDLLVLDNETAQLQVGNLVPYQTGSLSAAAGTGLATSTSVDYRQTGVITQVTPRVNSGGLVTLDITQEVSGIATGSATVIGAGSSINSPTFTERAVKTRVVIQDGQTVGLAGLITDQKDTGNRGLPWLKDIPILGLLTGSQANTRMRTELLVLLTPHVLHDQRDARALTEDLREQLPSAAETPYELQSLRPGGSTDPQAGLRRSLGLSPPQ